MRTWMGEPGLIGLIGVSEKLPWGSEVELKWVLMRCSGMGRTSREQAQHVQRHWEKTEHGKSGVFLFKGWPKKPQNLCINNFVFLTCLNFSHLQSTLYLMQYTCQDIFFYCSKQFLNLLILMPFSASTICLFVCFTSSTSAKHFPLRTFFIWVKKGHLGRSRVN